MSKFIATGKSGTIGRHLPPQFEHIDIDLSSDKIAFDRLLLPKDSHLLHLAGVVGPLEVEKNPIRAAQVNLRGTELIAKEFQKKSNGKFYFVSTSHVYQPSEKPLKEESQISPINTYAMQKYEAETTLKQVFVLEPDRLCILRLFSVLDWDVAPFTLGGAIKKIVNNEDGFVLKNVDDIRDFLTPLQIAAALTKIINRNILSGVFNLSSGQGISVGQAAKYMLKKSGLNVPANSFATGNSAMPYIVGDNGKLLSKIQNLNLKWSPSTYRIEQRE